MTGFGQAEAWQHEIASSVIGIGCTEHLCVGAKDFKLVIG